MTLSNIKKTKKDKKLFAGFTISETNIARIREGAKEANMTKSSYLDEILNMYFSQLNKKGE